MYGRKPVGMGRLPVESRYFEIGYMTGFYSICIIIRYCPEKISMAWEHEA